jgi:PPM family protein phosphatase
VYDHNEDALLLQVTTCYFNSVPFDVAILAIADGIGGHEGGEAASKTAVTGLLSAVFPLLVEGFNPVGNSPNKAGLKDLFRQAVLQANQAVFHQHQALQSDLGAALTGVWLVKGLALVANVGDSRTYLYRGGKLRQVTTDHSLVYRKMLNQEISRDDIYTHPQRNVIYRSLGEKEVVDVDTFAVELEPGDLLVLCCDGLWEMGTG